MACSQVATLRLTVSAHWQSSGPHGCTLAVYKRASRGCQTEQPSIKAGNEDVSLHGERELATEAVGHVIDEDRAAQPSAVADEGAQIYRDRINAICLTKDQGMLGSVDNFVVVRDDAFQARGPSRRRDPTGG